MSPEAIIEDLRKRLAGELLIAGLSTHDQDSSIEEMLDLLLNTARARILTQQSELTTIRMECLGTLGLVKSELNTAALVRVLLARSKP